MICFLGADRETPLSESDLWNPFPKQWQYAQKMPFNIVHYADVDICTDLWYNKNKVNRRGAI